MGKKVRNIHRKDKHWLKLFIPFVSLERKEEIKSFRGKGWEILSVLFLLKVSAANMGTC